MVELPTIYTKFHTLRMWQATEHLKQFKQYHHTRILETVFPRIEIVLTQHFWRAKEDSTLYSLTICSKGKNYTTNTPWLRFMHTEKSANSLLVMAIIFHFLLYYYT